MPCLAWYAATRIDPARRRLAGLLAAACLLSVTPQVSARPLPNRLVVDMNLVSSGDRDLDGALRQWSSLLRLRLPNLLQDQSLRLANANRIQVRGNPVNVVPTPATMADRWRQNAAIQVVAALSSRSGSVIVVDGSIYFGGLKGALPSPQLAIRQTVRLNDYKESADVVSLAMIYALAMDAGPSDKAIACELLQRGRTIGLQVPANSGARELKSAVASSLQQLGCRAGR